MSSVLAKIHAPAAAAGDRRLRHRRFVAPRIATEIAPGWNADGAVWDPFPPGRWQ